MDALTAQCVFDKICGLLCNIEKNVDECMLKLTNENCAIKEFHHVVCDLGFDSSRFAEMLISVENREACKEKIGFYLMTIVSESNTIREMFVLLEDCIECWFGSDMVEPNHSSGLGGADIADSSTDVA